MPTLPRQRAQRESKDAAPRNGDASLQAESPLEALYRGCKAEPQGLCPEPWHGRQHSSRGDPTAPWARNRPLLHAHCLACCILHLGELLLTNALLQGLPHSTPSGTLNASVRATMLSTTKRRGIPQRGPIRARSRLWHHLLPSPVRSYPPWHRPPPRGRATSGERTL